MIWTRLCQALAAGTTELALGFLADIMVITEPEGYIRTFVDEGRLLAPLLRQAVARGIRPRYASRLLSVIEAENRQRKIRRGELPASSASTSLLSERELDVLRLLATGISSRQIADRLTVSLNTANTHIRHIFEKLDSRNRVQAVARARELKLVQ
jgi:LuxR family maltose regulon positive regulatory protein